MTTKYDDLPLDPVLSYMWFQLQAEGLFNPADYYIAEYGFSIIPIIPAQDQPETANQLGNLPYIVYDYYSTPTTSKTEWWRNRDEIIFSIYCPDVKKIQAIGQFIKDKFQRMDEAAADINAFIGPSSQFTYHLTEFITFEVYRPAKSEGGRMVGEATISYEYVRQLPESPINMLVIDSAGATSSTTVV